jgi:hypothetical protein
MSIAYWVCAIITGISSFVSFGYAAAGLVKASGEARTGVTYALARSGALAAIAVIAAVLDSPSFLSAVAIAMVRVQASDAVIGAMMRDRTKTIGPAVTAVFNLAALVWLLVL